MSTHTITCPQSRKDYVSAIISLAWPIFIEQLLISLVQVADSAMVGSLGAAATAAVAINSGPYTLINGVISALGVGFTSLIARSIGAQDMERAKLLTRQAILVIAALCIPLSFVCYFLGRKIPMWMGGQPEILDAAEIYNKILALSLLFRGMTMVLTAIYRGYGDSKTPMMINVIVNILNVIGNFLMIYPTRELTLFGHTFTMIGCGWGVAGAAVSTSLSGILGGASLLTLCFTNRAVFKLSLKDDFRPNPRELKAVFHISFPAMLERFIMGAAFIVVGRAVASLGTAAVAAHNLSGTIESLSFMPGFAFGASITTLFGQSVGAKKYDQAHHFVVETIKLGTLVMIFMTIMMYIGSNHIMTLFTPDQEVVEMGGTLLKILAVIQIPQMIAMVYSGALKGAGDAKSPFLIALISMWGVRLLGTVLCVHVFHLGLVSACISMCADNAFRCLLFHLRYRQGTWKHISE